MLGDGEPVVSIQRSFKNVPENAYNSCCEFPLQSM